MPSENGTLNVRNRDAGRLLDTVLSPMQIANADNLTAVTSQLLRNPEVAKAARSLQLKELPARFGFSALPRLGTEARRLSLFTLTPCRCEVRWIVSQRRRDLPSGSTKKPAAWMVVSVCDSRSSRMRREGGTLLVPRDVSKHREGAVAGIIAAVVKLR